MSERHLTPPEPPPEPRCEDEEYEALGGMGRDGERSAEDVGDLLLAEKGGCFAARVIARLKQRPEVRGWTRLSPKTEAQAMVDEEGRRYAEDVMAELAIILLGTTTGPKGCGDVLPWCRDDRKGGDDDNTSS